MQRQAEKAGYFPSYLCTELIFRLVGLSRHHTRIRLFRFFEKEGYFLISEVLPGSGV